MPDFLLPVAYTVLIAPFLLVICLGGASLVFRPLSEKTIGVLSELANVIGLLAAVVVLGFMLWNGIHEIAVPLGSWVHVPEFHFSVKFQFDRLSVPFVILTFLLCGTIGAFATRYMHREKGFNRFFVSYSFFMLGMVVTSLAGTIETLFAGWELVGLSSALLVAFFHERANPVRNGLWVWSVYRISDAALLVGAIVLHHLRGAGEFDVFLGQSGTWPLGETPLTHDQAFQVGGLMLLAAIGKSAMVPFSGWLPKAMEGPTPSSAVFYGALSVHLGAFLLLRVESLIDDSMTLRILIVAVGLISAAFGTFAGRVQTDIKSALSFASLTQVGIIFAEIGFGLRYIALIHILGHASLRTLQFLRAPNLLQDYNAMENALGTRLVHGGGFFHNRLSQGTRLFFYRFALERGYLDAMLWSYIVEPFLRVLKFCDYLERRWVALLSGTKMTDSSAAPQSSTLEDLL